MSKTKETRDYKAEVMYESKGKTPSGQPFMTVKKARNYYEYAERGGVDSVAFILFDNNKKEFALIDESKPPLDERLQTRAMLTTAFGGSLDKDISLIETVKEEVKEEAGYEVQEDRIHETGMTLVSSQMSQYCWLYLVDVTDLKKTHQTEAETSKSEEFKRNSVIWMSYSDILENQDWKSIFIATRAIYKDIITKD